MKLLTFINKIKQIEFIKNFSVLVGGSAIAQGLGIFFAFFLARIYSPEQFGVFGTILTISGIVSLLGSLKYESAIVLENDDEYIVDLQHLTFLVLLVVTLVFSVFIFLLPHWIIYFDFDTEFSKYFIWAIPIVFFSALYNILYNRYNRDKLYKEMAVAQIVRKSSVLIIQLVIGYLSSSVLGLIFGNIIGVLIVVLYLFLRKSELFPIRNININRIKEIGSRYKKFPQYIAPQSLLNLTSVRLPILVLGYYFSIEVVGAFFFTIKFVQLPATMIGSSIRQVFYKEIAAKPDDHKNTNKLYNNLTLGLFLIVVIPSIVLFLFGPELFSFFFGKEWILAGQFASWMFLWYGSNLVAGPARSLFLNFGKQNIVFYLDLILFIIRGAAIIILSMNYEPIIGIAGFSIITMLFNLIVILGWKYYLLNELKNA